MAKYKDKWKTTFPTSIGNQTRPEDGVDNTQEYNTDGLPQYMANDPVRYDLQNAVNSQLVSNDERLNEKIERTSDDLAAHNKDPKAHATGIAGNAATASKLASPRTISLTGKAAGSTTFDGSSNAAINVTSVNADTASKLSTARKINITGNATGAAAFDGSGDISINTTVNESKHAAAADRATADSAGNNIVDTYVPKTGTGATGTWNISITGNAATATADSNGDKIDDTYLKKATVIDVIYPVGSIYMSMVDTDPATLFGVGTWTRISQGRMLLGADDSTYKAGATGGEATHTLTAAEMPAHNHGMDGNGNHRHYIANTDENGGGWLGNNAYLEHKYVYNSYENFELYGTGNDASVGLTSSNGWHTHNIQNSGGGAAHNNMPPYLVCYIWQRTA